MLHRLAMYVGTIIENNTIDKVGRGPEDKDLAQSRANFSVRL